MDEYDYKDFCNPKICSICNKKFNKKDIKVKDHDHEKRKLNQVVEVQKFI